MAGSIHSAEADGVLLRGGSGDNEQQGGISMRTILCYGDSNTWGYNPESGERFAADVRWTGVLREELGDGYNVIEEGLNGRTTVWDDPIEGYKNGKEYLVPCLESHKPIDLVIIMLGTNDLKMRFSLPPSDIAAGAGVLVDIVQKSCAGPENRAPEVLLLAPPHIKGLSDFAEMFAGGPQKSLLFAKHFKSIADMYGCYFLDAASVVEPSPVDGVHLEESEHLKLGTVVAEKVRMIFKKEAPRTIVT